MDEPITCCEDGKHIIHIIAVGRKGEQRLIAYHPRTKPSARFEAEMARFSAPPAPPKVSWRRRWFGRGLLALCIVLAGCATDPMGPEDLRDDNLRRCLHAAEAEAESRCFDVYAPNSGPFMSEGV